MTLSPTFWVPPTSWHPDPLPLPFPQPEPPAFNWNRAEPVVYQQQNWSCSCASAAWVWNACGLRTAEGRRYNEYDVIAQIRSIYGYGSVTPDYGLAFADMHQMQGTYESLGLQTERRLRVGYLELAEIAGVYPGQVNGGAWNHHSGLRDYDNIVLLANPAPNWKGVGQELDTNEFATWGPFSVLYVTGFA